MKNVKLNTTPIPIDVQAPKETRTELRRLEEEIEQCEERQRHEEFERS